MTFWVHFRAGAVGSALNGAQFIASAEHLQSKCNWTIQRN